MNIRAFRFLTFLLAALVFLTSLPTNRYASAATPSEEIRATIEYAQKVLNDLSLSEEAKKELLKKAAYDRFDFTEMSKRVLARHWTELTAVQQREFVALFTELLERVYFNRIKLIQDAKFSYGGDEVDKDFALVRSKAVTAKGETVQIEYRLRFTEGKWKIYDVGVEGISLVSNYRTQFNQILSKGSVSGMLQKMREKLQ